MPLLTRWYLRSSLVYFLLALLLGTALVSRGAFNLPGWTASLNPVYFHFYLVGWVTNLIFGVVYWMFPQYSREEPRRSEPLAWATYLLLNGGLIIRAVAEPAGALTDSPLWGPLLAGSAVLQWLAGLAFVFNTWPRVKGR